MLGGYLQTQEEQEIKINHREGEQFSNNRRMKPPDESKKQKY